MDGWYRRLWAPGGPESALYRGLAVFLAPAEWVYRLGVALRGRAYDRNLFRSTAVGIPTLGVGNLTVGGTGKTPIAAWIAHELVRRGRNPAIVLRGYGGDEVDVHRILNPDIPVYPSADRVAAAESARSHGHDVVVLDDAFQHRALRVDAHIVLVAAEEWSDRARLLPRGPWREPPRALERARLAVITRKTASPERAREAEAQAAEHAPALRWARARIGLAGLARYDATAGRLGPPEPVEGVDIALALAGVGRPRTLQEQLSGLGARVQRFRAFPDHHRFDTREIAGIRRTAGGGTVVMTLKDAVKLAPALGPDQDVRVALQEIHWEFGSEEVDRVIGEVLEESSASGRTVAVRSPSTGPPEEERGP